MDDGLQHEGQRQDVEAAISVFKYLEEVTSLRSRTTYSVDSYEDVVWIAEMPVESEVTCGAIRPQESESEDTWLSVSKPQLTPPPAPPREIKDWLLQRDLENSELEMPELQDAITIEETVDGQPTTTALHLEEHPTVQASWESYVERYWWPWATEDRRARAVSQLYSQLFSMYQRQQRLGEEFEIILGLGLLRWQPATAHEIKRHLIVANGTITFDPSRGLITFGPSGSGTGAVLEEDMLAPDQRPDATESAAVAGMIADIGDAIWDEAVTSAPLRVWVNSVSSKGRYAHKLRPQAAASSEPTVHIAPAIILRRRAERSLLKVIRDIAADLGESGDVPQSLGQLIGEKPYEGGVDEGSVGSKGSEESEAGSGGVIDDVLFPLAANDDQFAIVRRLVGQRGVLVQGPPGTGKSHTIVNLICHLLATGKRVLVTSHGARALQVLRRYLLEKCVDVSPLAVLLLGNDREALGAMEESVQGITSRHSTWQPDAATRSIAELERELARLRAQEAELRGKLRELRMVELNRELDRGAGYRGSPQVLAQRVARERKDFDWLQDAVEGEQPCLTHAEAVELASLLRDPETMRADPAPGSLPDRAQLPAPLKAQELFDAERALRQQLAEAETGATQELVCIIEALPSVQRSELAGSVSRIQEVCARASSGTETWQAEALAGVLSQRAGVWLELSGVTREQLEGLAEEARWADRVEVAGLGTRDLPVVKAEAADLLQHFEKGGGLGFGPFRSAAVKRGLYLTRDVRVRGRLCAGEAELRDLLRWIDARQRVEGLGNLWAARLSPSGATLSGQVAEFSEACRKLQNVLSVLGDIEAVDVTLNGRAGVGTSEDIRSLVQALEVADMRLELLASTSRVDDALAAILTHPSEIAHALANTLRDRDGEGYRAAYAELERLEQVQAAAARLNLLQEKLESGAPLLGHAIAQTASEAVWSERLPRLPEAWAWRRTVVWLEAVGDPEHSERLRASVENCGNRIAATMQQLVANRAWCECFTRMGEDERQHLVAWSRAVRQIGRGTGKYASRHRRTAHEHMQRCQGAIPAWIMPIYRVAESIGASREAFDVVIVDEASQSGPEAVFLGYIAKQMIVVGDDRQISPDAVGIDQAQVNVLQERLLKTNPHRDSFGVDRSLFDLAEIKFPGRIRLREHFRCMPEIIQFSNRLCYQGQPLVPLRQYGGDRLEPVLTRRVSDGYLKGSGQRVVNPPEAQAIVDQLAACCDDPRYDGRTFGVISLLGPYQAREIESLLLERLGPEVMSERQIVCGDAYAFQGDERDIVFLSMVSAVSESRRIGTLVAAAFERRFNVAASRARDQMWLFHSVDAADLGTSCLRRRLLEYCLDPQVEMSAAGELSIAELQRQAMAGGRDVVPPPVPFESWFEVDVYLELAARQYSVVPQFEIAGRRIDILIMGRTGRLAVECDGDHWHGPDRYEEDDRRQRQLERCGLHFWRVRGSAFYLDPARGLESLWAKLSSMDIRPTTEWEGPASDKDDEADDTGGVEGPDREPPREPAADDRHGAAGSTTAGDVSGRDEPQKTPQPSMHRGTRAQGSVPAQRELPIVANLADAVYTAWESRDLPDPKEAPRSMVINGLLEIASAEGPVFCRRLMGLYREGAGYLRMRSQLQGILLEALQHAVDAGQLAAVAELRSGGLADHVVRLAGTPEVVVRPLGGRTFHEVPPREQAALVRRIWEKTPTLAGDELCRAVLEFYGLKRLTGQVRSRIRWVEDLAKQKQDAS